MFSVHYSGSKALLLRFKQEISFEVNFLVLGVQAKIKQALQKNEIYGIDELVSAYASLLIYFDPCKISLKTLLEFLEHLKKEHHLSLNKSKLCLRVPLSYDKEFALDLDFVCEHTNLSEKELIALHTKPKYFVYMLGFLAGFAYLGGLDERLFTPRLASPRTKIQAGSVGIADKQTGIYPISSPGGWQIIARTPLKLFDKDNELEPTLLEAGMFLEFKAVDKKEFKDIEEQIANKTYKKELYEYKGD